MSRRRKPPSTLRRSGDKETAKCFEYEDCCQRDGCRHTGHHGYTGGQRPGDDEPVPLEHAEDDKGNADRRSQVAQWDWCNVTFGPTNFAVSQAVEKCHFP